MFSRLQAYIAANNELKKECGTYMPHLSLIYSDMTEQERTEMVER